jgi:hypothetical protein
MTDIEVAFYILLGWLNGFLLAYFMWAPLTSFKQGVMDGLSLKFIWKRFVK